MSEVGPVPAQQERTFKKARAAVDAFRDFAREHGMSHFVRDPLVMEIHNALDKATADLTAVRAQLADLQQDFSAMAISCETNREETLQAEAALTALRADMERVTGFRDRYLAELLEVRQSLNIADPARAIDGVTALRAERDRLDALINNPHTDDFLESVRLEAAHQRERWAAEHDGGKTDADWFWLIGYLAGKALNKPEKRLHHVITTAAAALNWHAHLSGASTSMRPGIADPELAEVRARLALPAWQPIETAPKDGSYVLAIESGRQGVVRWIDDWNMWEMASGVVMRKPAHWMPLPAPPSGDTLPAFITREGHDGTAPAPDESD